jgi:hypothetical protein
MLPSAALTGAVLGILAVTAVAAHALIDLAFRVFGG